jgi:Domain of unknown function DUF29
MTSLYEKDFAQRVERRVGLLRSSRATALDVPHPTLELEGSTRPDERALGARLKRIMARPLKQRHQPERVSRSRADSIASGREEIADILEQSQMLSG